MEFKKFEGIHSAIFSVYDENLNVIEETVEKMVNYQLEHGVRGFYVGGNTGECTVLPAKTRKQMLEAVIRANKGRGQIMAHIGAGHFDETMELLDHANSLSGVDAIASLPPSLSGYYDMNSTLDYYRALAERSATPVFAYITPVLNGSPVEFATRAAEIDNVAGIKLTVPDYFAFGRVVSATEGRFNILNGPDETMLCGLALGADGAIGTTYNILPRLAVGIYDDFKAGRLDDARKKQAALSNLIPHLLGHGLGYWKAALETMGYEMGDMVFPGKAFKGKEVDALREKLTAVGFYDLV